MAHKQTLTLEKCLQIGRICSGWYAVRPPASDAGIQQGPLFKSQIGTLSVDVGHRRAFDVGPRDEWGFYISVYNCANRKVNLGTYFGDEVRTFYVEVEERYEELKVTGVDHFEEEARRLLSGDSNEA